MSQENEVRIKHVPRTPTEVLYQQTVDELRSQVQRERALADQLAEALRQAHKLAANQLAEPVNQEFDTGTLIMIATVLGDALAQHASIKQAAVDQSA